MARVVFELSHGVGEAVLFRRSQIIYIFAVDCGHYRHFNLTCLIHFLLHTSSALVVLRLVKPVELEVASVGVGAEDVAGNHTEVSRHELLIFLRGQDEELLAVLYILSLHELLDHLRVEDVFYGACVHLVLVFAPVQHGLDRLHVLHRPFLCQLKVSFPSLPVIGEVLVLLVDA